MAPANIDNTTTAPEGGNVVNFASFFAAKADRQPDSGGAIQRLRTIQAADREAKLLQLKAGNLSPTSRNLLLRQARQTEWFKAWRVTRYWRARVDWQIALECAQRWGVGDSKTFDDAAGEDRATLLALWRTALGNLMLTPAPTQASVEWKRAQLRGGKLKYCAVKPETFKKAIDDDVKWLKAHPVRRLKH